MDFIKKTIVSALFFIPFFLCGIEKELSGQEAGYALDAVVHAFEKKMEGKFGLTCCMSGARMPCDIQRIDIGFQTLKKVSLEEAREIAVVFMEEFLSIINQDEKIRPYLREYPFTVRRISMRLSFKQESNNELHLFLVKNQIIYETQKSSLAQFVEILKEPYEEATKIVRKK